MLNLLLIPSKLSIISLMRISIFKSFFCLLNEYFVIVTLIFTHKPLPSYLELHSFLLACKSRLQTTTPCSQDTCALIVNHDHNSCLCWNCHSQPYSFQTCFPRSHSSSSCNNFSWPSYPFHPLSSPLILSHSPVQCQLVMITTYKHFNFNIHLCISWD